MPHKPFNYTAFNQYQHIERLFQILKEWYGLRELILGDYDGELHLTIYDRKNYAESIWADRSNTVYPHRLALNPCNLSESLETICDEFMLAGLGGATIGKTDFQIWLEVLNSTPNGLVFLEMK